MKQTPLPFCTASGGTGEWWDSALSKRGVGLQGWVCSFGQSSVHVSACQVTNPTSFTDLLMQRQLLPLCAVICEESPLWVHGNWNIICPVLPFSFAAPAVFAVDGTRLQLMLTSTPGTPSFPGTPSTPGAPSWPCLPTTPRGPGSPRMP